MKVISIVGDGKTVAALPVERLIKELSKQGTVGTIMQTHEEILAPGQKMDAGVEVSIAVTPTMSIDMARNTDLKKALERLSSEGIDFAVVEGFEQSDFPKMAVGDAEAKNVVAHISAGTGIDELVKIALAQPDYVTLQSLVAKIKRSPRAKEAGAIGTFTGMVREMANNERTTALEFESFDEVMKERIKIIEDDLKKREGILEVIIYHKTGRIEAGEDIVFIVILSGHRGELFPALKDAIERVKDEVPIWKKEFTVGGDFWVHDIQGRDMH